VFALTRIPVKHDVAMTGEITLRGRVLPIGGLKEKVLAAHRAGIKTVCIPEDNEKDIREIPKAVLKALTIIPVSHMDQVLKIALDLENPDAFEERLSQPLLAPELRASEIPPGAAAAVEPATAATH
jgi:ATP-dependent Lon protease